MPIRFIHTCRHCGVAIEPTDPMGAWIHTDLSIYCPGSGGRLTATPIIRAEPRRTANGEHCAEFEENGCCIHSDHTI